MRHLFLDLLTGKNVRGYLHTYMQTRSISRAELEEYQLEKLRKLLLHCHLNVPYYSKILNEQGIDPLKIQSLDVLSKLPILTKEIIRANYQDFMPRNLAEIKGVKNSYTGGTTGMPLLKRTDAATRSSTWALYALFQQEMGIGDRDIRLILTEGYGKKKSLKKRIGQKVYSLLSSSIPVDTYADYQENLRFIENCLRNKDIKLIRSYTQFLFNIARDYDKAGKTFQVKAITTTAEPLFEPHRALFRRVFGCETYDQYGCGEIGSIAYECSHHKGLHVSMERVIFETDPTGATIVTDLDNFAMPYIRYMNGDEVEISDEICGCGRESQLIKGIKGRVVDYLYGLEGQKLHSSYIWDMVFSTGIGPKINMQKFQVHQVSKEKIIFRLVSDPIPMEDRKILAGLLHDKLGNIEIEFVNQPDIANSASGKFRPVLNDILV